MSEGEGEDGSGLRHLLVVRFPVVKERKVYMSIRLWREKPARHGTN